MCIKNIVNKFWSLNDQLGTKQMISGAKRIDLKIFKILNQKLPNDRQPLPDQDWSWRLIASYVQKSKNWVCWCNLDRWSKELRFSHQKSLEEEECHHWRSSFILILARSTLVLFYLLYYLWLWMLKFICFTFILECKYVS